MTSGVLKDMCSRIVTPWLQKQSFSGVIGFTTNCRRWNEDTRSQMKNAKKGKIYSMWKKNYINEQMLYNTARSQGWKKRGEKEKDRDSEWKWEWDSERVWIKEWKKVKAERPSEEEAGLFACFRQSSGSPSIELRAFSCLTISANSTTYNQ